MIEAKLISFLEDQWEIPNSVSIIYPDGTGYAGIDLDLLMIDFGEKFQVDMSGFDPDQYYVCDADVLNWPKTLFTVIFFPHRIPKKTFTFQHLVAVAEAGKWFDP